MFPPKMYFVPPQNHLATGLGSCGRSCYVVCWRKRRACMSRLTTG